jgi:defect-in-organelle-trafficking protein DotD
MIKTLWVTAVATLLLSGCQQPVATRVTQAPLAPEAEAANAQRVAVVRAQQYQLWDENVVNTRTPLPADTIYSNSTRVSLDWVCDTMMRSRFWNVMSRTCTLSGRGRRTPL